MIVAVPGAIPVTIPEDVPTVATDVFVLLHEPPVMELLKTVELPTHTLAIPVIAAGLGLIVTETIA